MSEFKLLSKNELKKEIADKEFFNAVKEFDGVEYPILCKILMDEDEKNNDKTTGYFYPVWHGTEDISSEYAVKLENYPTCLMSVIMTDVISVCLILGKPEGILRTVVEDKNRKFKSKEDDLDRQYA